jgi:hypothetical protein
MAPQETPQPPRPLTWLGGQWHDAAWAHPFWVAAGTFAAGEAAHLAHLSPWYAAAAGLGAAACGLASTAGHRFAEAGRLFMTAAGTAVGGWLTWACATSPFNAASITAAVIGAGLATATYPGVRHAQLEHEERLRALAWRGPAALVANVAPGPATPAEALRWQKLMAHVGLKGLIYLGREANKAGFAVRFRLPASGNLTFQQVANNAHKIEIAWPGGRDGMVRVERARDRNDRPLAGEILIHFDVRDILAERIDMPMEHTPLTVNEAFPIGEFTDGEPICLTLREVAALVVGLRGRGKTNLLAVIIHQLSRCVDLCLWAIDLKGGRAVKPWLKPWLDGDVVGGRKVQRPIFDWVATTRREAGYMLAGANALIAQRGDAGAGGTKITPSRQLPAVLILIDEAAALVGRHAGPASKFDGDGPTSSEYAKRLTLGIQLGRSEAVDFLLCTQRATVTMMGGGDLKSQIELRIALGVSSANDARSVFQGDAVSAKLLEKFKGKRTRGAVLVQEGEDRAMPGKAYYYGDDKVFLANVYAAAAAHADLPAPLDQRGQRAVEAAVRKASEGVHGYLDRWDTARSQHLYTDDLPDEVTDADLDAMEQAQPTDQPSAGGRSSATAVLPQQTNRFFPRREHHPQSGPEPVVDKEPANSADPEWDDLVSRLEAGEVTDPEPAQASDPDARRRMVAIVDEAGSAGTTASRIYLQLEQEGLAPRARQTLHTWLNAALDDGLIVQPGGRRGLYYTPRHTIHPTASSR